MPTSPPGIAAYTPRILREWLRSSPDELFRRLDASLAFVDISGFTQLSENLAKRGRVGAEELTDTINGCFTRLLAVAYENGGSLLKFGGDALLLMFTGDDHPAAACRAANGMNASLAEIGELQTPDGPVTLRMSTGVHTGDLHLFLVGGSHRELVVAGPEATTTVRTEAAADAGEVLVSDRLAAVLPDGTIGTTKGSCALLVASPLGTSAAAPAGDDDPALPDAAIPVALRAHARATGSRPEHRRVTVAFLRFQGFDDLIRDAGTSEAARQLDRLVRDVQIAADARGVAFLGTDIDADGGKIILTAGAPVSTGNDEERMLLTLRDIVATERGIPVHIGVNTDHVFAGDIGPHYRRSYTVMGDGVNLAARLMAKAPAGEVLATQTVLEHSRTTFEAVALEPFHVKGKAEPVQALRVGDATGSRVEERLDRLPLIGRDRELAQLGRLLDGTRDGTGAVVEVIGEPGVGKSKLLTSFCADIEEMAVHTLACELYESSTPYAPFRRLLRSALDVPPDADDTDIATRLASTVRAEVPDLAPWLPLLGVPLDLELPPTRETASLEDRFRRARTHDAVTRLLGALWSVPTLLVVEDAQWMDEASADLLGALAAGVDQMPLLLCVSRRDEESGFTAADQLPVLRLRLAPLDVAHTAELALIATDDAPLPQHELDVLVERSGGNPLFLEELIAASRQVGGLGGLPDSVEAVVTARVDKLPVESRMVLRNLSVLGQSTSIELARAVLAEEVDLDDGPTWQRLASFLNRDGGTIRFRSTLIRDAAYQGLPFRDRHRLHETVGETLARSAGSDADEHAELLSYHYFLAERFDEAWRYSLTAAERAASIFANVDSARFYARALEAAAALDGVDRGDLARTAEAFGDVLERIGEFERADDAYRQAARSVADDLVAEARLLLKRARVHAWVSDYDQALDTISQGMLLLDQEEDLAARRQRAQLLAWYAHFSQDQGHHETALVWNERAIAEAEASDEKDALAHAYKTLDRIHTDLGELERATFSCDALALYEELGDLASQATVLNNMGAFAYLRGEWAEARRLYERALDLHTRTGNEVQAAFCRNNIAEILSDQGHLEEAEGLFREVERVWRAAGDRGGVAYVRSNLGRVAARAGRAEEACGLLRDAVATSRAVGAISQALEAEARIAESHVLVGEPDEALTITADVLTRTESLGGTAAHLPLLHRVRGYAHWQRGELELARQAFEESCRAAETRAADFETALTLVALHDLGEVDGRPLSSDLLARGRALLSALGVERLPAVPLGRREGSRTPATGSAGPLPG